MKKIYRASNYESAKLALDYFGTKWWEKYSYAYKSWVNNFEELTTFFDYTHEIRKIIYTTNPIENLNRSIRKCTKNKGSFPTIKSLEKSIFLAIREASKKWNIKIQNWGTVLNQLHILFDF